MARVEAVLRRSADVGAPAAKVLSFNDHDLLIDDAAGTVEKAGLAVSITPREFRLLRLFAGNPGRVFSREELIARALGDDFEGSDRTIDAHVKNLRHKIETDPHSPRYIHTVHGIGYRFSTEGSA
jgi:DNA-binding response OmpR family regulator